MLTFLFIICLREENRSQDRSGIWKMEKVERVACAFSTIIPSKSTLGIEWRKNNWVRSLFRVRFFFFGTVKVDVKSDRILISSFIERFNKLDRSLHYQEGASFLLCACTERRGAEIAWNCLRGQRGNAEGKCRSWKLAKGELDWKVTSIDATTSWMLMQTRPKIPITGSLLRAVGSRANVSRSNPTRAFSHEKLARSVHFWCVREESLPKNLLEHVVRFRSIVLYIYTWNRSNDQNIVYFSNIHLYPALAMNFNREFLFIQIEFW